MQTALSSEANNKPQNGDLSQNITAAFVPDNTPHCTVNDSNTEKPDKKVVVTVRLPDANGKDSKDGKKDQAAEDLKISPASKILLDNLYSNATNIMASTRKRMQTDTWATGGGINRVLEQTLGNYAYVIHPDLSSIASPTDANDQKALDGATIYIKEIQALLATGLDKPIVMVINTKSVEVKDSKDTKAEGGSHWQTIVVLPKNYKSPLGIVVNSDREKIFFIDSLYPIRVIPPLLEQFLKQGLEYTFEVEGLGKVTHKVPALCVNGEFINCAVPQQSGAEDCGWWAVYNALMFVLTGTNDFLKQFKQASREPGYLLRGLFSNLDQDVNAGKEPVAKKPYETISSIERMAIKKAIEESLKVANSKALSLPSNDVNSTTITEEDHSNYGYPTDFLHGLLAAHISEECGFEAGKSLIKDGDAVDFKLNPDFLKMLKSRINLL